MKVKFGHIIGAKIGQLFKDMNALRNTGIYTNTIKGIWAAVTGACSIVLSGGYPVDKDFFTLHL